MNLAELAFACYVYSRMTDYDSSFLDFRRKIHDDLDLTSAEHRQALMTWLNQWGCRQFSKEYHEQASEGIFRWYKSYHDFLPAKDTHLLSLSSKELELTSRTYANLKERMASQKDRGGKTIQVSIGPTGAAKILFALRPHSLAPWDEPIRAKLAYDASAQSYYSYHMDLKRSLMELDSQCKIHGITLDDLPKYLDRPHSSTPKLIDEFYWVTITKNCQFPGREIMNQWSNWNKS